MLLTMSINACYPLKRFLLWSACPNVLLLLYWVLYFSRNSLYLLEPVLCQGYSPSFFYRNQVIGYCKYPGWHWQCSPKLIFPVACSNRNARWTESWHLPSRESVVCYFHLGFKLCNSSLSHSGCWQQLLWPYVSHKKTKVYVHCPFQWAPESRWLGSKYPASFQSDRWPSRCHEQCVYFLKALFL